MSRPVEFSMISRPAARPVSTRNVKRQLINQSNFYSANISGKARLSVLTAESMFNSKIEQIVL